MSQNNDISKTGVDFYACSQLCEDNNCKSFDYEVGGKINRKVVHIINIS